MLVFALSNMMMMIPLFVSETGAIKADINSATFRIMHINVETHNREFELVKQ